MKYVEMTFKVPEGYEKQVSDIVAMKIEGILSTIILTPTEAKKAEFSAELSKATADNIELNK